MDDRTFDRESAQQWIGSVEGENGRIRDTDIYPKVRDWMSRVSPVEVLDVGCGQGIFSEKLDLVGRHYTGAEPSPFLLGRAKERYASKNARFVSGNAYSLPFPDGTFDAAFSVLVWHLLERPAKAVRELSRVLKPGGNFLLITANPEGYPAWKALYTDVQSEGARFEGTMQLPGRLESHDVLYLHSLNEIVQSLNEAGLEVTNTETFRLSEKWREDIFIALEGRKSVSYKR